MISLEFYYKFPPIKKYGQVLSCSNARRIFGIVPTELYGIPQEYSIGLVLV